MAEITLSESVPSPSEPPQEIIRDGERDKAILIKVLRQTLLPFFVAGLGQICTGLFFERAQHWWFFLYVPEAFILVPALLGLKGNLEVTYASRFCTLTNAGQTNKANEIFFIARFNLCLVELQAIVLSFLAALLSSAISLINCDFKQSHGTVVLSSGVYAASLSSFVVGFVMIAIVVFSRRYGADPDNIAAPLTATFSDFVTLIMLIGVGMLMVHIYIHKLYILNIVAVILLLCTTPFLTYYVTQEPRARSILRDSSFAITAAIVVGCCSGLLLQSAIVVFPGIAAFHPLIAGLGGNRVSVQSSRLATALHLSEYSLGRLPAGTTIWTFLNPLRFFCLRHLDSKVAFLLLVTAIPYNFLFVVVVIFTAKNIDFSWIFVVAYVVAALVQGLLLFYLCQVTVYGLWWFRMDPDNSSVPVLTSIGDLLGIGLLYIVFSFLHRFAPSTVFYQQYQTMNITRQCGIDF
ncbi:Divalent cation transporter family protein [Acanthocheilonema viteae]